MSYFRRGDLSWSQWARRRFKKIIVPYWIVITFTFILVTLANYVSSEFVTDSYSWRSVFTYVTFTRNFYSPGWGLNPTMWFMPVIVGLYVLFPVLVKVLEKYGAFLLLTISTLVTYGSITLCIVLEHPVSHQTALPLFLLPDGHNDQRCDNCTQTSVLQSPISPGLALRHVPTPKHRPHLFSIP